MTWFTDERGSAGMEYALIAGLVAAALILSLRGMGGAIAEKYQYSADQIQTAGTPPTPPPAVR